MTYPGGKSGAGVYQTIINQIPPHEVYVEPFAGGAGVFLNKTLARQSHLLDVDDDAIEALHDKIPADPAVTIWKEDALLWMARHPWTPQHFVYCDPPYVLASRKGGKIYNHEFSNEEHCMLLLILQMLPCPAMVSGYPSELYDRQLTDWRRVEFQAMTRGGLATEVLWMNYDEPSALHDNRYIGDDYRERERIARKRKRWLAKFQALPDSERVAIFSDLERFMRVDNAR